MHTRAVEAQKNKEYQELQDEVHHRLQGQDYRAIVWGIQKQKKVNEAKKKQEDDMAEKRSQQLAEWKKSAVKFQSFTENRAVHEKKRKDAIEAERNKDELKDLRRSTRHIDAMLKRKREKRFLETQKAEQDLRNEVVERKLMQGEDEQTREYDRLLRLKTQGDAMARHRLLRKKNGGKHHHVTDRASESFRANFESAKRQRLRKQRFNRMIAIIEHNHFVMRHIIVQERWHRWVYTIKIMKFKDIMQRSVTLH